MKIQLVKGQTSVILTVFILDSSSTTGAGLGSLLHTSSIVGGYVRAGSTGVALAVDEDVTTEGTYQAPSANSKMRIGTPANMTSGTYELHLHNDICATGADIVTITLSGATNMAPLILEVQLTTLDLNSAIIDGSGRVDVGEWLGTAVTLSASAPDVNIQSTDSISLGAQQKLDVNTEVDNAIVTYKLDHLIAVSVADEVVDDCIIAKMTTRGNTADWSDFNNKKESLAAIRKRGDQAWTGGGITGTTLVLDTTVSVVNSQTDFDLADSTGTDGSLDDMLVVFYDTNDDASIQVITASLSASNNIVIDEAASFTVASSDVVQVFAVVPQDGPIQGDPWAEFPGRLFKGEVTGASTTTSLVVTASDLPSGAANDDYNDTILIIRDASAGNRVNVRKVDDFIVATPAFVVSTLGFTPAAGDQIEVWISATAAGGAVPELGGFGTTSPTRVFDYITAMMSDGATDPVTGIADYDPATDSLEAIKNSQFDARLFSGTATGSSTTTKVFVQSGDTPSGGADDDYNDTIIAVWRGTDKSTARVNLRVVTDFDDSDPSFTLTPALGFTPQNNDLVEVYVADAGTLSSLTKLTTGFGTTSPDTLEAYLVAIMSKTASTPANAGTYSAATDSLEFLGERNALIEGSGFGTSTDSLKAIRDAIDSLVAPAVVGASSLSGSGFLSDCVTMIRRMTDEPSLLPKYTDSDIVEAITSAMTVVMSEVHNNSDHNILCRFNVQLVTGQQTYILPPNVGEIWAVRKMSTTTPTIPIYEAWPDNHWSSHQSGFVIEHNEFRLLTDWRSTDILEILYIPNGESFIHKATAVSAAAKQIVFPTSVTDGTLDTRQNSYAGYLLRILSNTDPHIQERIIESYDNITRVAVVTTPFTPVPSGTVVYEVLPTYGWLIKDAVCLQAAMDVLANEGNTKRLQTQTIRYNVKMRALRQMIAKKSSRFGGSMEGDTSDNDERGGFYGWLVL